MNHLEQQLALADGRMLGFAELGPVDGIPVFYNHGFPASRLEAQLIAAAATRLGLHLIAVDRPGFGLSSPQPGRTLLDWPVDIAALADHLKLPRFAMLGVSGGGPATLACARQLPQRLTAVSVVCGLGPVAEPELRRLMQWPARFSFTLSRLTPTGAKILFSRCVSPLLKAFPAVVLKLLTIASPASDAAVLREQYIREVLADCVREAFRQGGAGPTAELALLASPWPFELAAIDLPISFWHGREDATVPFRHCEWLVRQLPSARCHEFLKEGHFSLPIRNAAAILGDLRDRHLSRCGPTAPR